MKILDDWIYETLNRFWLPLLISLFLLPLLVGFLKWTRLLPSRIAAKLTIVAVLPLATWLAIVAALILVTIVDERSIHLRLGADTFELGKEAYRQGIPMVIETHSGVQGYTAHFETKYLPQARELCKNYLP